MVGFRCVAFLAGVASLHLASAQDDKSCSESTLGKACYAQGVVDGRGATESYKAGYDAGLEAAKNAKSHDEWGQYIIDVIEAFLGVLAALLVMSWLGKKLRGSSDNVDFVPYQPLGDGSNTNNDSEANLPKGPSRTFSPTAKQHEAYEKALRYQRTSSGSLASGTGSQTGKLSPRQSPRPERQRSRSPAK